MGARKRAGAKTNRVRKEWIQLQYTQLVLTGWVFSKKVNYNMDWRGGVQRHYFYWTAVSPEGEDDGSACRSRGELVKRLWHAHIKPLENSNEQRQE